MRKIWLLFPIGIFLLFFTGLYLLQPLKELPSDCPFCNEKILQYQTFYEDELVAVLYNYRPITPCHILIIPKRHVERFEKLSEKEIVQISKVIKKVDVAAKKVYQTSPYLLLQKNGVEVGQSVSHLHFHYIAKPKGDRSTWKLLLGFYFAPLFSPIDKEKMHQTVKTLKDTMASLKEGSSLL